MFHPEGEKLLLCDGQDEADASVPEPQGSLAVAIAKYQDGDPSELGELVFTLHSRLVARAEAKLRSAPTCGLSPTARGPWPVQWEATGWAMGDGKYRDMKHGSELLGLLAGIVDHKVARQIRKLTTIKAGGGKVRNEPDSGLEPEAREQTPPDALMEREAQAHAMAVIDRWRNYMRDKGLLEVAELVMEGQGNREIAKSLGIGENRARRMITLVNALTRAFGQEENPEP